MWFREMHYKCWGTRGWRRRAANRDKWRRLMREAKTRRGL